VGDRLAGKRLAKNKGWPKIQKMSRKGPISTGKKITRFSNENNSEGVNQTNVAFGGNRGFLLKGLQGRGNLPLSF